MKRDTKEFKILIIEDNAGDFLLIQDYLDEYILATSVERAATFKEAEALLKSEAVFDVVLLDLTLPDNKGEMLIRDVIELAHTVPVIALTGFSDLEFSVKSVSMGIYDYLLKDDLNGATLYKSIVYNIEKARHIRQLVASEKRYSDLFHLSPQPMWVFDSKSLAFLDVNDAAILHYGYSREEFLSMTIRDIRPVEDIPIMDDLFAGKNTPLSHHFKNVRHKTISGDIIHVEIQTKAIQFKERKAQLVLASDISERIQYITAIEQQNEKLREISWIQSHVVRAPLARLMGLTQLLKDYPASETEQKELLRHMTNAADEVDKIIREIVAKAEQINHFPPQGEV